MRKRGKTAHYFTVGEEKFKSERLGFLEANELLIKYAPLLDKISEIVSKDPEGEGLPLAEIVKNIPEKTVSQVCKELLCKTEVETDNIFKRLDPEEFDSLTEMFGVVAEVFKLNYPDFFGQGQGTEEGEDQKPMSQSPSQIKAPDQSQETTQTKILKL